MSMSKKEVEMVVEIIGKKLDGVTVTCSTVEKNNKVVKEVVVIKKADDNVAPMFYIDNYANECSVEEIADNIISDYKKVVVPKFELDKFAEKDYILKNVEYRLVNEKNISEDRPYKRFLDLALIYRVKAGVDENGEASFVINKIMMNKLDITEQELDKAAQNNLENKRYSINSMTDIIESMMSGNEIKIVEPAELGIAEKPDMIIISTCNRIHGASALLRADVLDAVAKYFGKDFYILPSSVHELIAVSCEDGITTASLKEMVSEVNATEVDEVDILNDNVYRYNAEKHQVEIA